MSLMLVTHDLGVVAGRTDEIVVMYGGRVVEKAPTRTLFAKMKMPYTEALMASIPKLEEPRTRGCGRSPAGRRTSSTPRRAAGSRPAAPTPRTAASEEPPLFAAETPDHEYACWFPVGSPEYRESRRPTSTPRSIDRRRRRRRRTLVA